MKTIKTKKSVGKAYVFIFSSSDKQTSNSNISREVAEKSLEYYTSAGLKCSEISEVELFETVEEQVPEVGRAWIFFYKALKGDEDETITPVMCYEEWEAIACRKRYIDHGFECSEIKLLREEF